VIGSFGALSIQPKFPGCSLVPFLAPFLVPVLALIEMEDVESLLLVLDLNDDFDVNISDRIKNLYNHNNQ